MDFRFKQKQRILLFLILVVMSPVLGQKISYYPNSKKILTKTFHDCDSAVSRIENYYKNGSRWLTVEYDSERSGVCKEFSKNGKLKRITCQDSLNHIISSVHFFANGDTSHINEKDFIKSINYYRNNKIRYKVETKDGNKKDYRYWEYYRNGELKYHFDRAASYTVFYRRNGNIRDKIQ